MRLLSFSRTVRCVGAAALLSVVLGGCTTPPDDPGSNRVSPVPTVHGGQASVHGGQVSVPVEGGTALIDTTTLAVRFQGIDGSRHDWSGPAGGASGVVGRAVVRAGTASWQRDGRTVSVGSEAGRLKVAIEAKTSGALTWPTTGVDPSTSSIEFPNGPGQTVPVKDAFWSSSKSGLPGSRWNFAGDLTMPFWGSTFRDGGVAYEVPTDIGSSLAFSTENGRVRASARHDFDPARKTSVYEVLFAATDGSPIAAAADYRIFLRSTGSLPTLDDKIARNPEAAKLLGAPHAYLWGDGRTPQAIAALKALGIDKMWLGYDSDGSPLDAATVAAATAAGYLVGPYDTWSNAQDPATADSPSSVWPGALWPDGCVVGADGKPVVGFGGSGCYLSSTALAAQGKNGVLRDRVADFTKNGSTSYFLDVDAVGQLFADHSPTHPATEADDRRERLARLEALQRGDDSRGKPLVVGSETAAAWAAPGVSFSHGSSTALSDGLWSLQKDTGTWGAWWPDERPGFFFKPVDLPADLVKAMFDPRYQVPLYATVLHDSVVSTDRWELGLFKFPGQVTTRVLASLLRNEPVMLSLTAADIDEHGQQIAAIQKVFAKLQTAAGTKPMTSFGYAGDDNLVQRAVYGDGALVVTVNFGQAAAGGVQPGCAAIEMPGSRSTTYCP